jgi:hypothetical protein
VFVLCRQTTGGCWEYWTGIGIRRRRQRWTRDVNLACLFFRRENGWHTLFRLKERDGIVFPRDAVGEW